MLVVVYALRRQTPCSTSPIPCMRQEDIDGGEDVPRAPRPTKKQRAQVEAMAGYGMRQEDIDGGEDVPRAPSRW